MGYGKEFAIAREPAHRHDRANGILIIQPRKANLLNIIVLAAGTSGHRPRNVAIHLVFPFGGLSSFFKLCAAVFRI